MAISQALLISLSLSSTIPPRLINYGSRAPYTVGCNCTVRTGVKLPNIRSREVLTAITTMH